MSLRKSAALLIETAMLSDNQLMKIHIETLFTYDANQRLIAINEPDGRPAPRFSLGRTLAGNVWRFRYDLPDEIIERLGAVCDSEPESVSPEPYHKEQYIRLLQTHGPVERVGTGPAFRVPISKSAETETVKITRENTNLLPDAFGWLRESIDEEQPCLAVVQEGQVVSICRSVRIGAQAHEAGVETLAAYRGNGFAPKVVAAWTTAVQELGVIPLYSTSWDNLASQNVARKLAALMYGVTFHIT